MSDAPIRIVPVDPTSDMNIAGGIAICEARETAVTAVDEADACYRAMLTAAPVREEGGAVEAIGPNAESVNGRLCHAIDLIAKGLYLARGGTGDAYKVEGGEGPSVYGGRRVHRRINEVRGEACRIVTAWRESDPFSSTSALATREVAPAWRDVASAPEGVEAWGFRPAPDGVAALYGVVELVQSEDGAWFDADGDEVTAPTLWAPTNKPPHPITGHVAREEAPAEAGERDSHLMRLLKSIRLSELDHYADDIAAALAKDRLEALRAQPQAREEAQPVNYDARKLKRGDEVWIRAMVTDPCTSCCGISVKAITGAVYGYVKPADVQTTPPAPEDEKLRIALEEAADAIDFFDRVKAATGAERTAVGSDHWKRMEDALRALAALRQEGR